MAQQTQKPTPAKPDDKAEAKQAEKTAEVRRIEQDARGRAEQIRTAAERDAQRITEAAQAEADKIRRAAEADARRTRKAMEAEARRTELATQAREAEARDAEEAAQAEAERIRQAAGQSPADSLPAVLTLAQEQLQATTQLTQSVWERNLEFAVGMVPAYLKVYEDTFKGFGPLSHPAEVLRESAEAGAVVTHETLNI